MEQVNVQKSATSQLGLNLKQALAQTFARKEVPPVESAQAAQTAEARKAETTEQTLALLKQRAEQSFRKVEVNDLKSAIGEDQQYLRDTLKTKLMEYGINPNTRISVEKNALGKLQVSGPMLRSELDKINTDINNDPNLMQAFQRVSQQKPTLSYVSNVVKLSEAYGANNNLFNSLISEDDSLNKLSDISNRYETLKTQSDETTSSENTPAFKYVLD